MSFRAAFPIPLTPVPAGGHGLPPSYPLWPSSSVAEHWRGRSIGFNPAASLADGAGRVHDARNLLAALSLYADLLGRPGVLDREHAHYADELRDLARRSASLLCTPSDGAFQQESATAMDPAQTLRRLLPLLERIASPSAHVEFALAAGLPCHAVDAETLERIVVNLVRNAAAALAATPPPDGSEGVVAITLERTSGDGLALRVADNGPGLPLAVAVSFAQPAELHAATEGHGLGLRIVRELAGRSGAVVRVHALRNSGTSFEFCWGEAAPAAPTPRLNRRAKSRVARLPGRRRAC